jgi:hypothetical protein
MPKKLKMNNLQTLAAQTNAAVAFMGRYAAYARSVGCKIDGDAIHCTSTQAKLLRRWWDENSRDMGGVAP